MAIQYRAEVENGNVKTVAIFNSDDIPYQFETWVVCPEGVVVGWTYNGNTFSPPAVVPPTSEELDALAEQVSEDFLNQDLKTKALALVLADMIENVFNVSQSEARQQVRTRFKNYYRGLL